LLRDSAVPNRPHHVGHKHVRTPPGLQDPVLQPPGSAQRGEWLVCGLITRPDHTRPDRDRPLTPLLRLALAAQGYDELAGDIDRPLIGGDAYDDHAATRPAAGGYRPPAGLDAGAAGGGDAAPRAERAGSFSGAPPTQAEELREVAALGRDAAEILWEMVVTGEGGGGAAAELRASAAQLRGQLRGLVGDYASGGGADEALMAGGLEALDALARALDGEGGDEAAAAAAQVDDAAAPAPAPAPALAAAAPVLAPPPRTAPAAALVPAPAPAPAARAGDAPLIDFD
jgi:hypothetical protein